LITWRAFGHMTRSACAPGRRMPVSLPLANAPRPRSTVLARAGLHESVFQARVDRDDAVHAGERDNLDATGGTGADRGMKAVGYQARDPAGAGYPASQCQTCLLAAGRLNHARGAAV
jgi:hypothetical protein